MKDIKKVELLIVQEQERLNKSSIQLSNHDIHLYCPSDEVECYQVILEKEDVERVFILCELGFNNLTDNNTFRLSNLKPFEAQEKPRVQSFLNDKNFDLRLRPDRTIILFGTNLETSALTATDGNHRLMAHFIEHNDINGVSAFIYIHRNINRWGFIPPLAR